MTKLQSSRFPLCLLTTGIFVTSRAEKSEAPVTVGTETEVNVEADRLSNGDWEGFDPQKRIQVEVRSGKGIVSDKLMAIGSEFYRYMKGLRRCRADGSTRRSSRKRVNTLEPW